MNLFNPSKTIKGDLVGVDGNAYAILGYFKINAQKQGWSKEDIQLVLDEARTGDYYKLIYVISCHMSL